MEKRTTTKSQANPPPPKKRERKKRNISTGGAKAVSVLFLFPRTEIFQREKRGKRESVTIIRVGEKRGGGRRRRLLHVKILACFFLPFFDPSCMQGIPCQIGTEGEGALFGCFDTGHGCFEKTRSTFTCFFLDHEFAGIYVSQVNRRSHNLGESPPFLKHPSLFYFRFCAYVHATISQKKIPN